MAIGIVACSIDDFLHNHFALNRLLGLNASLDHHCFHSVFFADATQIGGKMLNGAVPVGSSLVSMSQYGYTLTPIISNRALYFRSPSKMKS